MSNARFLHALNQCFDFLSDIMNGFISVFKDHPWLFSMIVAPVIVSLIIFGVSISYSLISNKNSIGKGER